MEKRGIAYVQLTASRYAGEMHKCTRRSEPEKLADTLIVGAIIEARSCERFAKLAPFLDDELKQFYLSLLKSESRHFKDYLSLAQKVLDVDISDRVQFLLEQEKLLIEGADEEFRFHSGVLAAL